MQKKPTTTSQASTLRPLLARIAIAAVVIFLCSLFSRAGGPKRVAGTSYFDPSTAGQPVVWPMGQLTYYTDQGDLSPILPASSADAFVANAFGQWTSVSTAALSATNAGHLAEDVNGSNVTRNSDGTLTIPADIQPGAISTPIGIVYDYDGAVTDAFLGSGAGNASQCFFNAAFGGADSYGLLASFQHALVVINGVCNNRRRSPTSSTVWCACWAALSVSTGRNSIRMSSPARRPPRPTTSPASR